MARHRNHHLYQDKKSGVWYFQMKARGIERPYKFSLKTTSVVEARALRDEYMAEIRAHGHLRSPEPVLVEGALFGEIAQKWAEIKKTRVEETTFESYQKTMNFYVLPVFGNRRIETITTLDIELFISRLKCKGKSKRNIMTPFRDVMRFAKKHHFIKSNPMVDVEPIKVKRGERAEKQPLNLEDIQMFLAHLDEFWKPLFTFMFFSGVRVSEAAGLKWKRVHLDKGLVQIRKVVVYVHGRAIYKTTKTEGSVRDVKLHEVAIEALREQRKRTWKGDRENFVFQNTHGRTIHRQTLNQLVVKPTLREAGLLDNRSIKETRSSYITNALDCAERMSFIQKQVGHVNTKMIVEHYYRFVPADDDGKKLESAWKSTSILPDPGNGDLELSENKR